MGRTVASPPPVTLPKVSFIEVDDDFTRSAAGVSDAVARSYGYNDASDFKRPDHYIRYIEPLESELAGQVEYDMDEQDQAWLDVMNAERKERQTDTVSYEIFEIVMDRLEKEWFDLTKNIPKPDMALPSEDSTCAICDDSEGENTNAIVFCDGCNLAVHQDCYGVPYIPEGQWLCRKCTVSPENPVSCILCPNEGGAFKQTVHGDWVHLLCAIWVPETRVGNDVFMEPITGIDKISKQRWRLKCSICDIRQGACIQCTKSSCFLAFHATCARKEKLLMPMKASQGSEAPTLAAYCEKHLPKEQQDSRIVAAAAERDAEVSGIDEKTSVGKSSKTARAYAKTYKPGPPLVPHIIIERVLQYITKLNVRQKRDFVLLVCKYWSLKREARRGAAFLKRLHLEPWTASAGARQQTEEEKTIKLNYMKRLREDLERVRVVAELVRKRENLKLDRTQTIQDVFEQFLFGHEPPLRMAFERIMSADRNDYFKNPVSKAAVPDYYDIVKNPMTWTVIDNKLDAHVYLDFQEFKNDVNLVISNAMLYNKPGTPFYKAAQRIQTVSEPIMIELDKIATRRPPSLSDQGDMQVDSESPLSVIGDLEPSLRMLELLDKDDAIKDDIDLILNKDPVEALFSYELPRIKPPSPPSPPKSKRNRKMDLARKRRERLDQMPGFRAPRTRRATAVFAQFEAEASGSQPPETPAESAIIESEAGPSTQLALSEGAPRAKPGRKRKRTTALVAEQPELPPMVKTVDNHQSFKMFDKGWILPPDQRRGNRPPRSSLSQPTPKKKGTSGGSSQLPPVTMPNPETILHVMLPLDDDAKQVEEHLKLPSGQRSAPMERETSHPAMSPPEYSVSLEREPALGTEAMTSSTAAVAGFPSTVHEDKLPEPEVPAISQSNVEPMEIEQPPNEPPVDITEAAGTHVASQVDAQPTAEQPVRRIVIDVLDTPATRREKNLRRKIEKARLAMEQAQENAETELQAGLSNPPSQVFKAPEGKERPHVIYIEELDTPAIRREKNAHRKAEKARMTAKASAALPTAGSDHAKNRLAEDNSRSKPEDADLISELSSLSDISGSDEEDVQDDRKQQPSPPIHTQKKPPQLESGAVVLRDGEMLEGGTLVWAKANSFPWWPAVVFELDDPAIPRDVLRARNTLNEAGPIHLVRFYDSRNSWQWVTLDKMRMLGEDDAFDGTMLATSSKMQKWKTPSIRQQCRDAYRRAIAEKETEGDDDHDLESEAAPDVQRSLTTIEPQPDVPIAGLDADSPMTDLDVH